MSTKEESVPYHTLEGAIAGLSVSTLFIFYMLTLIWEWVSPSTLSPIRSYLAAGVVGWIIPCALLFGIVLAHRIFAGPCSPEWEGFPIRLLHLSIGFIIPAVLIVLMGIGTWCPHTKLVAAMLYGGLAMNVLLMLGVRVLGKLGKSKSVADVQ